MDLKITIPAEIVQGPYRKYYGIMETVMPWQHVWTLILDMAYRHGTPIQSIYVEKQDYDAYQSKNIVNQELIEFDYIWKEYSGDTNVVPEFKELYVPYELFNCSGVRYLFEESFPNCRVSFW